MQSDRTTKTPLNTSKSDPATIHTSAINPPITNAEEDQLSSESSNWGVIHELPIAARSAEELTRLDAFRIELFPNLPPPKDDNRLPSSHSVELYIKNKDAEKIRDAKNINSLLAFSAYRFFKTQANPLLAKLEAGLTRVARSLAPDYVPSAHAYYNSEKKFIALDSKNLSAPGSLCIDLNPGADKFFESRAMNLS